MPDGGDYENGDFKDVFGGGDDDCMARVWMEFCLSFIGRWWWFLWLSWKVCTCDVDRSSSFLVGPAYNWVSLSLGISNLSNSSMWLDKFKFVTKNLRLSIRIRPLILGCFRNVALTYCAKWSSLCLRAAGSNPSFLWPFKNRLFVYIEIDSINQSLSDENNNQEYHFCDFSDWQGNSSSRFYIQDMLPSLHEPLFSYPEQSAWGREGESRRELWASRSLALSQSRTQRPWRRWRRPPERFKDDEGQNKNTFSREQQKHFLYCNHPLQILVHT